MAPPSLHRIPGYQLSWKTHVQYVPTLSFLCLNPFLVKMEKVAKYINFRGPVKTLYGTFPIKHYFIPQILNESECSSKYSDYFLQMT